MPRADQEALDEEELELLAEEPLDDEDELLEELSADFEDSLEAPEDDPPEEPLVESAAARESVR